MPSPTALPIQLKPLEQAVLEKIVRSHTSEQRLVRRAQILLKAHAGDETSFTSPINGSSPWRTRPKPPYDEEQFIYRPGLSARSPVHLPTAGVSGRLSALDWTIRPIGSAVTRSRLANLSR
jgi:hypothetical protein